jgi:hypothetical protein
MRVTWGVHVFGGVREDGGVRKGWRKVGMEGSKNRIVEGDSCASWYWGS